MSEHIIQLLKAERSRLQAAIDALKETPEAKPSNEPEFVKIRPKVAATPKRKALSAATRRRMAEGQRRRYAGIRAAKAEAPKVVHKAASAKAASVPVKKRALTEAGRKALSIAMKKRWAAKKKAAAKKAA
jgi:hypothetical protein